MKWGLIFLFILIGISSVFAQLNDYNSYQYVEADFKISSTIDVDYGMAPIIEYFKVKSNIRPINDSKRQIVVSENYIASPKEVEIHDVNDSVQFTWLSMNPDQFSFKILSKVRVLNEIVEINEKIKFPLENIPEDVKIYTQETEFIDINPEIIIKANEIVEGETDYYITVFALANWVENNINYTLDTLTENALQKSSWVIENKYGVCDELTNLFISLARSVGIPARFVSGQAYSNINDDFGNHGWAEVYFPGYGWVPFDITFKQFGWVDPSHIKIRNQLDSGEPAVDYSWRSSDASFKKNEIKIETDTLQLIPSTEGRADIGVEVLHDNVGPGSYVPIFVTIRNRNDYYLPLSIFFKKAPQLTTKNSRTILLEPKEEKNLIWIVKLPEEVEANYIYLTAIEVSDSYGDIAITNLTYGANFNRFSREEAEDEALKLSPIPQKELLPGIGFDCSFGKDFFYDTETITANCIIENSGNTKLEDINVCLQDVCEKSELSIGQKTIIYLKPAPFSMSSGKKRFSVETERLVEYEYENLHVVEDPQLRFISSEPKTILYGGKVNITLHTSSKRKAFNIKVDVFNGGTAEINEIDNKNAIILSFDTRDLNSDKVRIKIAYEDETGRKFISAEKWIAEVLERPFYASILYTLRRLFK